MDLESPPPSVPDAAESMDWSDSADLPVEEVRDVFITLTKALRAAQLYHVGNPMYERFLAGVADAFQRVWETRDRIQILIQEDRLLWMGEEVYRNQSRADSLSFLLYRDGIRDLTFLKGVEAEELPRLIAAIAGAKGQKGESQDLVTVLWDLDLSFVTHSAVDVGLDGIALPLPGSTDPREDAGVALAAEGLRLELDAQTDTGEEDAKDSAAADGKGAPAGVVSAEDFNPTLYAFDEAERRRLQEAVRVEMARDLRTDILYGLLDALEFSTSSERQIEVLQILRILLPSFLSQGALVPAAKLVTELRKIRARDGVLEPDGLLVAEQLLEELSSPESVFELIRALGDGSVGADSAELGTLLEALGAGALEPLLAGAESLLDPNGRTVLREAMRGIAEANRDSVVRLLDSSNPEVVRGAVHLVGRMRIEEAAGKLAELMDRGTPDVQRAVVDVAADLRSPLLAGSLLRLVRSQHRDLRVAAVRVLGGTGYPPAAKELRRYLEDKEFRNADVTEKVAFYEAYGLLAGEGAVDFLHGVLNTKGFLGRREPSELRAGAAMGLGKVASSAARSALEAARADEDPVVRSAVGRALRGEEKSNG
ncbi:MAG: hypothetical protein WD056_02820 [Gemmatimonadota bacterium]